MGHLLSCSQAQSELVDRSVKARKTEWRVARPMDKPLGVLFAVRMILLLPVRCVEGIQTVHETINGGIIRQTLEEVRVHLTG